MIYVDKTPENISDVGFNIGIPCIQDGEVRLHETIAIMHYLCTKYEQYTMTGLTPQSIVTLSPLRLATSSCSWNTSPSASASTHSYSRPSACSPLNPTNICSSSHFWKRCVWSANTSITACGGWPRGRVFCWMSFLSLTFCSMRPVSTCLDFLGNISAIILCIGFSRSSGIGSKVCHFLQRRERR